MTDYAAIVSTLEHPGRIFVPPGPAPAFEHGYAIEAHYGCPSRDFARIALRWWRTRAGALRCGPIDQVHIVCYEEHGARSYYMEYRFLRWLAADLIIRAHSDSHWLQFRAKFNATIDTREPDETTDWSLVSEHEVSSVLSTVRLGPSNG